MTALRLLILATAVAGCAPSDDTPRVAAGDTAAALASVVSAPEPIAESPAVPPQQSAPPPQEPATLPKTNQFLQIDRLGVAWDSAYGVASHLRRVLCLYTHRTGLRPGDDVWLVLPLESGRSVTATTVEAVDPAACALNGSEISHAAYRLAPAAEDDVGSLFIASFSPVDDAGGPEFRDCASMEGIHQSVWGEEGGARVRRWHVYYYVGYDLDPTCTEDDFPPP